MKNALALVASLAAIGAYAATVSVVVPQEGAAKAVTVGGKESMSYSTGSFAPLKATANAGWAFAGWYEAYDAETGEFSNEVALAKSADWRSPSANYVVGDSDVTLYARFVQPGDDRLVFDMELLFTDVLSYDFDEKDRPILSQTNAVDVAVEFESESMPSVTVTGLPTGLAFDKAALRLSGRPTAFGLYKVSVSAKNESGYTYSQLFYVRVGNAPAKYVDGTDSEVEVGEEVDEYIDDIFYINNPGADIRTISVTGLPAGLAFETEYDDDGVVENCYVRGTPTKAGEFTVMCKVSFTDGTTESAGMLYTVLGPDPSEYEGNVDFSGLRGRCVGESISAEDGFVIGEYDSDFNLGVVSVSGLPAGVAAVKMPSEYGGYAYVLKGTFRKAGEFTVSVNVAYEDWTDDTIKTVTLTAPVIVSDSEGVYVSASVLDPESSPGCKVSGTGVYSPGATVSLTATAGSGLVFAGWCDSAGLPVATGSNDYRKSPLALSVSAEADNEWQGAFLPKADDRVDLGDLYNAEFVLDPNEVFEESFYVESGSLPTLKFANLPDGLACTPSTEMPGVYVLSYDPVSSKRPSPGRYRVKVTATNVSRDSDTAEFLVVVPNATDPDIHVSDDYGVLTPNVAMEPISFSNAVDFARGDTLAVTGLPAGLKYNDKATPLVLSGIPTKPGEYTLTFAAKIVTEAVTNETTGRVTYTYRNASATAFIKVKDFPTVAAKLSDEAAEAGCKVTGAGSFKAGSKITLKAVPAADWTFAGWGGVEGLAALNPSLAYVVGADDLTEISATFIHKRDDTLYVEDPGVLVVVKGVAFSTNLLAMVETRSLPTASVTGLPAGLKFDQKTFTISGTVGRTAKAGYVYATVSAKNASGYAFVRVVKFVVVERASDEIPDEPVGVNGANIDFSDFDGLTTGVFYPAEGADAIGFIVNPAESGAAVTAVSVSGLPSGLKSTVSIEDGTGAVVVFGTPNKPGRCALKVQVTYADRKKATSEYAFTVEDGGSGWLDVGSFSVAGTVSGSGVYSSGATVKLSARPANGSVFAGWYEDEDIPFDNIAAMDGVDYRTAAATFVFRKGMFASEPFALYGDFVAKADDLVSIEGLDDLWEISPSADDEVFFTVNSASLPKLTATGLPKGVTLDAAAGRFVYSSASQSQIVPGFYTVTLKAVNQSNASATATLNVFVENKTSEAIGGLNPSADAYPLYAGVALDPALIAPAVDVANGWKLAAAGLPAGLKFAQDRTTGAYSVSGVPTKAGNFTVTFTASNGSEKQVATITVGVSALPAWAAGTFDGAYFEFEGGDTNALGQVVATMTDAGKVSGKILKGGKTYSFSAASYSAYEAGAFVAEVTVPWSTSDKEAFLLSVSATENGLGALLLEPTGDGAHFAEAVQNAWLRKDMSAPAFATGAKQPKLDIDVPSLEMLLTCKFGAKGVTTAAGTLRGVAVNGKAQALIVGESGGGVLMRLYLYFASAKFAGGSCCETVDAILYDTDGDGLLDTAVPAE